MRRTVSTGTEVYNGCPSPEGLEIESRQRTLSLNTQVGGGSGDIEINRVYIEVIHVLSRIEGNQSIAEESYEGGFVTNLEEEEEQG